MATKKDRTTGYFSKLETMTAAERRRYLNKKLKQIVAYAYEKAPAFKKKMDRAKMKPPDVQAVKDLERLGITEKTDLIGMQKKNPPFRRF